MIRDFQISEILRVDPIKSNKGFDTQVTTVVVAWMEADEFGNSIQERAVADIWGLIDMDALKRYVQSAQSLRCRATFKIREWQERKYNTVSLNLPTQFYTHGN